MITEYISEIAIYILDKTTYFGAFFLMMLESMIAPVPSEAVMPFVGFLVADGRWHLGLAIFATSLGSLCGSLLSYWMGYYGGKPFVLQVGKYLFLNPRDLERTERYFNRKQGLITVFIARFIPVVRHLISIPAGIGKMPLVPFLLVSTIGATMWNGFLLYCGMQLRANWTVVQHYSHQLDILIVLLCAAVVLWFFGMRWKRRRLQPGR
ncbi:MAG: DedA family protein [Desulfobulbaceae bacterium]|nr:DedA family protein [Desulfobulbaceae bacterium]